MGRAFIYSEGAAPSSAPHAEAAYITVRDPEGSLIQSSFVILVVMLLVVLVGSVVIVLPALYALNRLQNSLMERLLGIPPQVLTVRIGVCGHRFSAQTPNKFCDCSS